MEWFSEQPPLRCVQVDDATDHWHLRQIDIDPFEDLIELVLENDRRRRRILVDSPRGVRIPDTGSDPWSVQIEAAAQTLRLAAASTCGWMLAAPGPGIRQNGLAAVT